MAELNFEHSDEWMEKLTRMNELSPAERAEVGEHVQGCPDCSRYLTGFYRLGRMFQEIPVPSFPTELSPRLRQLWRQEDGKPSPSPDAQEEATLKDLMRDFME